MTHSKGYVSVEVHDQSVMLAEESKEKYDPITSIYSTVAYDDKKEPTYLLKPIGHIESCFREKFGTPRQGNDGNVMRSKPVRDVAGTGCAEEGDTAGILLLSSVAKEEKFFLLMKTIMMMMTIIKKMRM